MKKGIAMIPLILIVLLVVTAGVVSFRLFSGNEDTWICQDGVWVMHGNPTKGPPSTPCSSEELTEEKGLKQPTQVKNSQSQSVPLPSGEDIVKTFFELINEKKIPEAVSMMSKIAIGDDAQKQAWGVQFNAFTSLKTKSIETYDKSSWTEDQQEYKVNLSVQMKPEAADEQIPYYGYNIGDNNIRWVILVKENNLWKVQGIGTGP